jgi:hypothetical protein
VEDSGDTRGAHARLRTLGYGAGADMLMF